MTWLKKEISPKPSDITNIYTKGNKIQKREKLEEETKSSLAKLGSHWNLLQWWSLICEILNIFGVVG